MSGYPSSLLATLATAGCLAAILPARPAAADDAKIVAALEPGFQAAVQRSDAHSRLNPQT